METNYEKVLIFFAENPAGSIQCRNPKGEEKWIHCYEDVYDFFN